MAGSPWWWGLDAQSEPVATAESCEAFPEKPPQIGFRYSLPGPSTDSATTIGLLKISPFDSQRQESFYKLLLQFRESRFDPRKYRGLPEWREDTLCLSQMLKREGTLFLDLVKQAQNHLCAANMMPVRIKM